MNKNHDMMLKYDLAGERDADWRRPHQAGRLRSHQGKRFKIRCHPFLPSHAINLE